MFKGQVNKELWNVIKNTNKTTIIVKELTDPTQQNECRRLIDYCLNLVNKKFDRRPGLSYISKTTTGYTLRLVCAKKTTNECKNPWYIRINATSNEVNITCSMTCIHLFSDGPSNFQFLFFFYSSLIKSTKNIIILRKERKNRNRFGAKQAI